MHSIPDALMAGAPAVDIQLVLLLAARCPGKGQLVGCCLNARRRLNQATLLPAYHMPAPMVSRVALLQLLSLQVLGLQVHGCAR